jgi:hypothetical protein
MGRVHGPSVSDQMPVSRNIFSPDTCLERLAVRPHVNSKLRMHVFLDDCDNILCGLVGVMIEVFGIERCTADPKRRLRMWIRNLQSTMWNPKETRTPQQHAGPRYEQYMHPQIKNRAVTMIRVTNYMAISACSFRSSSSSSSSSACTGTLPVTIAKISNRPNK